MGKDPQKLREMAKKLLAEADRIENEKFTKIGKLICKYQESNFENFDLEKFKTEVTKINQ